MRASIDVYIQIDHTVDMPFCLVYNESENIGNDNLNVAYQFFYSIDLLKI